MKKYLRTHVPIIDIRSLYGDTYDVSLSKVDRVVSQEVRMATGAGLYNPVNVCREVRSFVEEVYDEGN